MSQIAIVNMKVQPGKYGEAVAFMQKHIPDTASFEGCESIRVAGSPGWLYDDGLWRVGFH